MSEEVLAEVRPSAPRRFIGLVMLLLLGGLLIYLAFTITGAALGWQLLLIALGLATLWMGQKLHTATERKLLLTKEALADDQGVILARIEDIASVDRGMLAIKPSNGFMLKLKNPAPRVWRPGLWWRSGRRVAIGGVTSSHQTKPMADIIAVMIARPSED